jgi:hypothetical protein
MPRWDDDRGDLEPEEPKPEPADWCPTCGESQAEHSKEQADRCFEGFLRDNELINKVIAEATKK